MPGNVIETLAIIRAEMQVPPGIEARSHQLRPIPRDAAYSLQDSLGTRIQQPDLAPAELQAARGILGDIADNVIPVDSPHTVDPVILESPRWRARQAARISYSLGVLARSSYRAERRGTLGPIPHGDELVGRFVAEILATGALLRTPPSVPYSADPSAYMTPHEVGEVMRQFPDLTLATLRETLGILKNRREAVAPVLQIVRTTRMAVRPALIRYGKERAQLRHEQPPIDDV